MGESRASRILEKLNINPPNSGHESLEACRQQARLVLNYQEFPLELEEHAEEFVCRADLPGKGSEEPPAKNGINSSVSRRLNFDDCMNQQQPTAATFRTNSLTDLTGDELEKVLQQSLEEYKKEKQMAFRKGSKSSAKRKTRKIKLLEDALQQLRDGKEVDLQQLPIHCYQQITALQSSCASNNIGLKNNNEAINESVLENHSENISPKFNTPKVLRKRHKCLYCQLHPRDYADHVQRSHKDTEEGQELNRISNENLTALEKSKLKRSITRKMTNLVAQSLNTEIISTTLSKKNQDSLPLHTVKKLTVQNPTLKNTASCKYCKGVYRRDKLWRHLKFYCCEYKKIKPKNDKTIDALKEHSCITGCVKGASKELIDEILPSMRRDDRYIAATMDQLIMEYGSEFQASRRHEKDISNVSSQCRSLAGLLIELKKKEPSITCLNQILSPKYFDLLITVIKDMSKFDPETGKISIVSLPYRLLPALKSITTMAKDKIVQESYQKHDTITPEVLIQIKTYDDFLDQLNNRWKDKIGKIALNSKKAANPTTQKKISLQEDIVTVCSHIVSKYRRQILELNDSTDKDLIYDKLLSNLVTHCMCLMRRRPVAFKLATVDHYEMMSKTNDIEDMAREAGLDVNDTEICKKFHIFYVLSKNGEVVPIALTKIMKEALDALLKNRSAVGISGNKLFLTSKGKLINPGYCLRKMKSTLKLKFPESFTPNGLRHHAATFSKLHSSHPRYEDYLAGSMGHTLLIHKKNYDLPQSILQKLYVVPTLHNMTVSESCLSATRIGNNMDRANSERELDVQTKQTRESLVKLQTNKDRNKTSKTKQGEKKEEGRKSKEADEGEGAGSDDADVTMIPESEEYTTEEEDTQDDSDTAIENGKKKKQRRHNIKKNPFRTSEIIKKRWSTAQRKLVFRAFGKELIAGHCPQRSRVIAFHTKYEHILKRSPNKVYTFIHNISKGKQKIYTPDKEQASLYFQK